MEKYKGAVPWLCFSDSLFERCVFQRNAAGVFGGAAYVWSNSYAEFRDCTFFGNSTDGLGGGIYSAGGSPVISNCLSTAVP